MRWIVWICIGGIVFSVAGPVGFFIMPLLWIAWAKWEAMSRAKVELALIDEEQRFDSLLLDCEDAEARVVFASLRPLIRSDMKTYVEALAFLKAEMVPVNEEGEMIAPRDWRAFLDRSRTALRK
jgi:hypothetical protein